MAYPQAPNFSYPGYGEAAPRRRCPTGAKVLGILLLLFGLPTALYMPLNVFQHLVPDWMEQLTGRMSGAPNPMATLFKESPRTLHFLLVMDALTFLLAILQVTGAIMLLRGRAVARIALNGWAITAIVMGLCSSTYFLAVIEPEVARVLAEFVPGSMQGFIKLMMTGGLVVVTAIGMVLPIVTLVVLRRPTTTAWLRGEAAADPLAAAGAPAYPAGYPAPSAPIGKGYSPAAPYVPSGPVPQGGTARSGMQPGPAAAAPPGQQRAAFQPLALPANPHPPPPAPE